MPLISQSSKSYWPAAFLVATLLNSALFLVLPRLGYSEPPAPPTIITVELSRWQPPAPVPQTKKPVAVKEKHKKLPKPKKILKPEAKPKQEPAPPKPEPVLTEKETENVPTATVEPVAEAEEDIPTPVPVFMVTSMPRSIHQATPRYPGAMRIQGKEGKVLLEVLVDGRGRVRQVKVIQSAGKYFDEAAIEAAKMTEYEPARQNGKPVAVRLKVPIIFQLN
ncbi:MAG: TonB family protein [Gammaproteobacteria bacterium]|nr:TonB family protein [Gammaproteobacteria bacterium]